MSKRKPEYKPLLFTTTVRNPSRLKGLLNIFSKFNNEILTDELAEKVMGELIRYGLYRPTKDISPTIIKKWGGKRISEKSNIGKIILNDQEIRFILKNNIQSHKEADFRVGWPSRFATEFDFAKELGFVFYVPKQKIIFSDIGLKLSDAVEIKVENDSIFMTETHPELEQQAFLQALVKYQRNNPFVRVKNENAPLLLLFEVITKLNMDKEFNDTGISKLEIPLIIFWKDNNSENLYQLIKKLRKDYGYNPSPEVIIDICINKIMEGNFKKFDPKSILIDYPDEFIRKMRITGLISLRGAGRFIDINKKEQVKVDYILNNYSNYKKYKTEKDYFEYMAKVDQNLFVEEKQLINSDEVDKFLSKWSTVYAWDNLKNELTILSQRSLTKDGILKYIPNSVRLEFLTALAIKSRFPKIKVVPNYIYDDEGLPTSTAPGVGDSGDIECYENTNGVLIEVTMSEGRIQTVAEVWPIARHLETFIKKRKDSICYFVAPSIFTDSIRQINYVKKEDNLDIVPKTIEDFLDYIEKAKLLYIKPSN